MKTLQYFTEGLLNKDNKTKAMSMVDVFLGDCIEGDPLSVWDAFENTGICKTSGRLVYDGYAYVHVEAISKRLSIRIPIENTTFYNIKNRKYKNIIVFEMVAQGRRAYTNVCRVDYEIPFNSQDKGLMVPIKEAIEMLRALLESNKFTAYPIQDSLKFLIGKFNEANVYDDHGNPILSTKIINIIKRWLEKNSLNGYKKERGT